MTESSTNHARVPRGTALKATQRVDAGSDRSRRGRDATWETEGAESMRLLSRDVSLTGVITPTSERQGVSADSIALRFHSLGKHSAGGSQTPSAKNGYRTELQIHLRVGSLREADLASVVEESRQMERQDLGDRAVSGSEPRPKRGRRQPLSEGGRCPALSEQWRGQRTGMIVSRRQVRRCASYHHRRRSRPLPPKSRRSHAPGSERWPGRR